MVRTKKFMSCIEKFNASPITKLIITIFTAAGVVAALIGVPVALNELKNISDASLQ